MWKNPNKKNGLLDMTKTALITGAAKRIGKGIALALAGEGYDIAVHFSESKIDAQNLREQLEHFGIKAACLEADLMDDQQISSLVERACDKLGNELTLLINNASIFEEDSLKTMTLESWDRHIFTNLKAPAFLSKTFANQVSRCALDQNSELLSKSNIINIIDQKVLNMNPNFLTYTLAKSGLWNLTRLSAQALGPEIRVNAIGPGPVLKASHQSEEHFHKQRKDTILGRGSDVDEICNAIRFILVSPGFTGQMLSIDGGEHLKW